MSIKGYFVLHANRPYSRDTMMLEMMDKSEGKLESHQKFAELLNTEGAYSPVAFVHNVTGIEEIFGLTNHIDTSWTDNKKHIVEINPSEGKRSTSVGDIILDAKKEKVFLVSSFGFTELTHESIDPKALIEKTAELTKEDMNNPSTENSFQP